MIAFVDNDIIVKLAALDMLDEAIRALGASKTDLFVLSTAKFKLGVAGKNQVRARARYGDAVYERVAAFVTSARELVDEPDPLDAEVLTGVAGIDGGEGILISAVSRQADALLATGDKKALVALSGAQTCAAIAARAAGRFVCLEQLLEQAMDGVDFNKFLPRVLPGTTCDQAIRAVFGSGSMATEAGVRAGLASYVADLRRQTGNLLRA